MATWILVLTMVGGYSSTSPAIAQVGPFKDESSCMAAAKAWLALHPYSYPKALCVKAS